MIGLEIRALADSDRADWELLWRGYLTFYKTTLKPEVTDIVWARFHDPAEPMFALGVFADKELIGFAHYLFHRGTWSESDRCYLEDLFVAENARGKGAGRALIAAVVEAACARGSERVYWHTEETNSAARALYDQVARLSGFLQYRIET